MRIRSAAEIEDRATGAEPSDRERRIEAGYRRLLRAVLDGKAKGKRLANAERGTRNAESRVRSQRSEVRSQKPEGQPSRGRRSAAMGYLSRFLSIGFALALLVTGCASPRPLKGGKAVTTQKPTGVIEQTLVQSENPQEAAKQDQESIKVRTYTVPAGSRVEQSQTPDTVAAQTASASHGSPPATLNSHPSPAFILSAPMPVVEREESRARTELGAAQKDTVRELGAKLSSLKGIVWVGAGLFVFGLASLVWPPLKVIIASVTSSLALMLGGVALMVLPTMVVGNELLILGMVALTAICWIIARRHGFARGLLAAGGGATPGKAKLRDRR